MKGSRGIYNRIIKRALDLICALLLAPFAAIAVSVCFIAIKLETSGPAFFVQERPGLNDKIFKIYKLRTMITQTVRDGVLLSDMQRITKTGKIIRALSLDELPQLYNIIRGEMSFIGPRPLLIEYLSLYSPFEARRHEVRPGISGWAQVNGRNEISWSQKFERDVWYVDNVSFALDIKIFVKTIANVLLRSGVNAGANETMKKFTGTKPQKKDEYNV